MSNSNQFHKLYQQLTAREENAKRTKKAKVEETPKPIVIVKPEPVKPQRPPEQDIEIYDEDIFNNPDDELLWAESKFNLLGH